MPRNVFEIEIRLNSITDDGDRYLSSSSVYCWCGGVMVFYFRMPLRRNLINKRSINYTKDAISFWIVEYLCRILNVC